MEVCLFEHESGLAVTLNEVALNRKTTTTAPAAASPMMITVSVQTDRPIKEVFSSYAGTLEWKREGGRIVVEVPLPRSVDVLVLR